MDNIRKGFKLTPTDKDKRIEELEKENAELKADYEKRGNTIISLENQLRVYIHSDKTEQLTKAKDILRMIVYWKSDKKELLNFINKAEQFLKEIE